MANISYGYWRTDKPAEDGYSQELISTFTDKDKLDSLDHWAKDPSGNDIKTLVQAMEVMY